MKFEVDRVQKLEDTDKNATEYRTWLVPAGEDNAPEYDKWKIWTTGFKPYDKGDIVDIDAPTSQETLEADS